MSHYAKVSPEGIVTNVIIAEAEFFESFIDSSPGQWLKTSYNTRGGIHYGPDGMPDGGEPLRKNFAGIGFTYDMQRDAFIPPKPFPSWLLNDDSCLWEAPVPMPADGAMYVWNEATHAWDVMAQP